MKGNVFEAVVGAIVLIVAAAFLYFAFSTAEVGAVRGYELLARFDRVDGLNVGSDVRVAGVKVGTVTEQRLDPKSFLAEVRFTIDSRYQLPKDTSAQIVSESLLGGKYLALVPGGDTDTLKSGGVIQFTQSAINLEGLIGQYIFGTGNKDGGKDPAN
ncbi:MAG: outer membrane lipid asymmetry maintenance protein MlaD [Alphaproteobacteria bacterium]|nr:outer membrane lipid asymmetry maintenance protein MlaD [Alphaproteobacteria bacterium]